jgi:6-phosphogluconolactonase
MRVYADLEDLARAARAELLRRAHDLLAERGRFTLALSGGSTPRRLYQLLAEADLDWSRVEVFFGDERCVPPDHADSNYRMAREALLDPARVPEHRVHRMRGELEPAAAAAAYEDELRAVLAPPPGVAPSIDLVLLGLGDDGHTASLFPGTAALDEDRRWVVANRVPQLDAWRLTMTYPLLNAASAVAFLVAGSSKREAVERILAPDPDDGAHGDARELLPAARVRPASGRLIWMLDAAAAPAG